VKSIVIIPARYASTRFPGKPLASIDGKPMIEHVYKRCQKVFEHVFVATDDERINQAVTHFGGKCVITASTHKSGTDRCAEAARIIKNEFDFDTVINVQGDEPFINQQQLQAIEQCIRKPDTQIATLVSKIHSSDILFDPNKVKAVLSANHDALYFSRSVIPFLRDQNRDQWINLHNFYLHLGIYAFKYEVLQQITQLHTSLLEKAEKLEQLRWLENGFSIKVAKTDIVNVSVDTPDDLEKIKK
jgi:3-deoxy-manno-octulosonate cytidylyltransferase (CMP-KDO synthetase)